jgi:hypothetical protein
MTPTRLIVAVVSLVAIVALMAIVSLAIGTNRLGDVVGGAFIFCVFGVALAIVYVVLRVKMNASNAERDRLRYEFIQNMAAKGALPNDGSFIPLHTPQLAAPKPEAPAPSIDPRHELLVSLCLLTIRADKYGPASEKLLTADDAQSKGGKFADRNNWDAASKYGQNLGLLYTQVGGRADDQGLKVNNNTANGGRTVTDLLETLHARNVIRDSAVAALPAMAR